jgi:cytochrome c556
MRIPALFTCGVAALALGCAEAPAPQVSADGRTPLVVPMDAADAVRAEMRTMLESIHAMLTAAPTRDTAAMRQAAIAGGMAAAADTAHEDILPHAFVELGVATHLQFDSLGAAIGAGLPADSALLRLAPITANCVSCHKTYRLEIGGDAH